MSSRPATPVRAFGVGCGLAVMRKSNLYLKGSRKGVGRDQPQHPCERLLRVPEVVLLLPLEPEAGGRAGEAGKAGRHLRSDSSLPGKNPVKRLTRDAKLPGRLADGETQAGQDVIAQDPARMGRSRRESVSGAGHDLTLLVPTVALWATGRQKQEPREPADRLSQGPG